VRPSPGDPFENPTVRSITRHQSIRRYTGRTVEPRVLDALIASAQAAPTSSHKQAYSVINVTDPGVRRQLAIVADDQEWVEEAPVFLVWCADLFRVARVVSGVGRTPAYDNVEEFIVACVDVTLAAAHAFVAAEALGLGGVLIGGLRNDPDTVTRLLGLPELVFPIYGMCLGYPAEDPGLKPRLPRDLVLFENRYEPARIAAELPRYDAIVAAYYDARETNTRTTTWTSEMVRKLAEPQRPHMRRYLETQGFRFD
jgi:FMN reductase (NADPH)